MNKGKLIVIEGGDGSGKTTQAHLLVDYFKKHSIPVKYFDFPQYYNSFHGKIIARYLRGELGPIDQVSPYFVSLAFAVDRASVKNKMKNFLDKGGYIIANRYATSSMVYQAAKFKNVKEQDDFLKWNYDLEYKVHKIPREDLVIYLEIPWQIGEDLTKKKEKRKYLNGLKQDIHEKDKKYRHEVEKMYSQLAHRYRHWITIPCTINHSLLSPELIHQKIIKVLRDKKMIGLFDKL